MMESKIHNKKALGVGGGGDGGWGVGGVHIAVANQKYSLYLL